MVLTAHWYVRLQKQYNYECIIDKLYMCFTNAVSVLAICYWKYSVLCGDLGKTVEGLLHFQQSNTKQNGTHMQQSHTIANAFLSMW